MVVHSESLLCTVVGTFDLKASLCPRLNLNLDHPLGSNCVGFLVAMQQGHRVYWQEEEDRNSPTDLTEPRRFQ